MCSETRGGAAKKIEVRRAGLELGSGHSVAVERFLSRLKAELDL